MSMKQEEAKRVPLFISKSYLNTESNKTGTWRFLRPRYQEKTAPCSVACPAGEDISRIQLLTTQGLFKEALETILLENPFPAVCGRICHHPCEKVCNRRDFDDAIAVHTIERFLAEAAVREKMKPGIERLPARKEKIAVVGAGPGGLAAAYFLARLGYHCEVHEAMPEPGGAVGWGIPAYRLAVAAIQEEIARIAELGVAIHCGRELSEAFLTQAKESYDAVFVSSGQSPGGRLHIPGEDPAGVEDGLAFLQRVKKGENPVLRGTVAVIGGDNAAVDVARCAVRLGAKAVIVYRRRRQDMPAFENEIRMALEEGVEILELRTPARVEVKDGEWLLTLQLMKMTDGDAEGGLHSTPEPGTAETVRVSRIFKTVSQERDESWMPTPESHQELLSLPNSRMFRTIQGLPVVFGGDLATPVKSVSHAVASGKEAALALDVLFREGFDAILPRLQSCMVGDGQSLSAEVYMGGARSQRSPHVVRYQEINIDYFQFTPRIAQPRLLKEERVRSFAEIDLRISASLAMQESERCFNCGLCNQCDNCRLFCPDLAVMRDQSPRGRSINYDYCKGCGICVVECPRNAMLLEEEQGSAGDKVQQR
jgi:NADPH-dependent glutamate synthase beta subunit-like oxidoreductase/Pyruvate/2-oxoacid:ferredoxin oxidoreductase delta subunit